MPRTRSRRKKSGQDSAVSTEITPEKEKQINFISDSEDTQDDDVQIITQGKKLKPEPKYQVDSPDAETSDFTDEENDGVVLNSQNQNEIDEFKQDISQQKATSNFNSVSTKHQDFEPDRLSGPKISTSSGNQGPDDDNHQVEKSHRVSSNTQGPPLNLSSAKNYQAILDGEEEDENQKEEEDGDDSDKMSNSGIKSNSHTVANHQTSTLDADDSNTIIPGSYRESQLNSFKARSNKVRPTLAMGPVQDIIQKSLPVKSDLNLQPGEEFTKGKDFTKQEFQAPEASFIGPVHNQALEDNLNKSTNSELDKEKKLMSAKQEIEQEILRNLDPKMGKKGELIYHKKCQYYNPKKDKKCDRSTTRPHDHFSGGKCIVKFRPNKNSKNRKRDSSSSSSSSYSSDSSYTSSSTGSSSDSHSSNSSSDSDRSRHRFRQKRKDRKRYGFSYRDFSPKEYNHECQFVIRDESNQQRRCDNKEAHEHCDHYGKVIVKYRPRDKSKKTEAKRDREARDRSSSPMVFNIHCQWLNGKSNNNRGKRGFYNKSKCDRKDPHEHKDAAGIVRMIFRPNENPKAHDRVITYNNNCMWLVDEKKGERCKNDQPHTHENEEGIIIMRFSPRGRKNSNTNASETKVKTEKAGLIDDSDEEIEGCITYNNYCQYFLVEENRNCREHIKDHWCVG